MKQKNKKQFKCEVCKNWFPTKRINQFKQLVDARKYFHMKIVCGRCFVRLHLKQRLNEKGIKENGKL